MKLRRSDARLCRPGATPNEQVTREGKPLRRPVARDERGAAACIGQRARSWNFRMRKNPRGFPRVLCSQTVLSPECFGQGSPLAHGMRTSSLAALRAGFMSGHARETSRTAWAKWPPQCATSGQDYLRIAPHLSPSGPCSQAAAGHPACCSWSGAGYRALSSD